MSGISSIYFLDNKGKVIIFRNYRGDTNVDIVEAFNKVIIESSIDNKIKPVFTYNDSTHFSWLKHNNIYIIALSKRNTNISLVFSFLHKIIEIFVDYFGTVEEETIRDNFVLIYEILDEICDHGYPQLTNIKSLKSYITVQSNKKNQVAKDVSGCFANKSLTKNRKEGIYYITNELYINVNEKVDIIISNDGTVLNSEINGEIEVDPRLTGNPIVFFNINDKLNSSTANIREFFDDVKFNECVDMTPEVEKKGNLIKFFPPDNKFQLLQYRITKPLSPLIAVSFKIRTISERNFIFEVTADGKFSNKLLAKNVSISVPVPSDIQNATFKSNSGKVVFSSGKECLIWTSKELIGGDRVFMSCGFWVPTVRCDDPNKYMKNPINVQFEIENFTMSNLVISNIIVQETEKEYSVLNYVKYFTKEGNYNIRII